jgi:mRNA interferase MazF
LLPFEKHAQRSRAPNRGPSVAGDRAPVASARQAARLRPVLVLSHDVFNERSGTVIAVAVLTRDLKVRLVGAMEVLGLALG